MSVQINQIVNANIYLDGNSLLGKAKEFKLPDIEMEFVEHKTLGMVGTVKLPAGVNAIEGEVIWDGYYEDIRNKAFNPFKTVQLMARSSIMVFNSEGLSEEQKMVTIMNVAFNKTSGGSLKNKEATEHSDSFQVYSIKQTVGGREVLFYDVFANIFKVNGEDLLANYRANVGQ